MIIDMFRRQENQNRAQIREKRPSGFPITCENVKVGVMMRIMYTYPFRPILAALPHVPP